MFGTPSRFAQMLRYLTAGESHGRALVVIVEGMPAGLLVTTEDLQFGLARRRLGFGRGPRMRFEADEVTLVAGVRHGRTLGSPIAIEIANTEWPKWEEEMSPAPGLPTKVLTQPRPGHADLAGMLKYGLNDARDVLERASARETAARVAAGTLAKLLLAQIGVDVISHIVQIGPERSEPGVLPTFEDRQRIDESPVRSADPEAEARMVAAIKAAAKDGDSLGGVAEVIAYGVPVGLGSYAQWDRRLDALLAQALMSIQAIKAVEIGDGLDAAGAARLGGPRRHPGGRSRSEDRETALAGKLGGGYMRDTHRAGGIEGGVSTGSPIVTRASMKPLATLNRPSLETVDVVTKETTVSFKERTDVTAVPAMGVVAETMVALVLAGEALRKFGGDSVAEFRRNRVAFLKGWERRPSAAASPPPDA